MTIISATQFKNNLGKYFDLALQGDEIIVTRYQRPILKLAPISRQETKQYLDKINASKQ